MKKFFTAAAAVIIAASMSFSAFGASSSSHRGGGGGGGSSSSSSQYSSSTNSYVNAGPGAAKGTTTEGKTITGTAVTTTAGTVEDSATGSWAQLDANGNWTYPLEDGSLVTGWAELTWNGVTDWYYFDANGIMQTGWITDPATGRTYYLHVPSDGTKGHMYTGTQTIDGVTYQFSTEEGSDKGHLLK